MDENERKAVVKALNEAAKALQILARGPQTPKAIFRYGSKPNQAPLMKKTREFLDAYAAAGNDLMSDRLPDLKKLEALATDMKAELDSLLESIVEQSP